MSYFFHEIFLKIMKLFSDIFKHYFCSYVGGTGYGMSGFMPCQCSEIVLDAVKLCRIRI